MSDESLDREQRLLAAARSDSPPKGARERMLLAMGVSAGASLAGAEAAAAALQGTTVKSAAGGASLLLKAVGLGAVAGAVGMAALVGLNREEPPKSRAAPSVAPPPSAVVEVAPPPLEASPLAEPQPIPTRAVVPPVVTGNVPAPSSSARSIPLAEIDEQRALVERAREALAAGRASTAIKALNEYEARFGFGVLGHEQVALKVRALLALGRQAEATSLGERYLAERPNGTQAATIRRLLGKAPPSDQK